MHQERRQSGEVKKIEVPSDGNMKKGFCIILLLYSIICSSSAQIPAGCKVIQSEVVVERIDSTNDYMIICAFNDDRKFKIVTRKVDNDCRNILVGDRINLSLCSLNSMDPNNIMPCDWNYGWPGDNNNILNEVEYGCDVFLTDDIFGLCFTDDIQSEEEYQKYIREHPLEVKVRGKRANNAQIFVPKVIFQMDHKTIEDSFVVKTQLLKSSQTRLTLNYGKKTIKVKIPNDLMSNVDSIMIKTFSNVEAKVVNIIDAYVCQEQWPVYHCYQCNEGYSKITTIYLYKNCELFREE